MKVMKSFKTRGKISKMLMMKINRQTVRITNLRILKINRPKVIINLPMVIIINLQTVIIMNLQMVRIMNRRKVKIINLQRLIINRPRFFNLKRDKRWFKKTKMQKNTNITERSIKTKKDTVRMDTKRSLTMATMKMR